MRRMLDITDIKDFAGKKLYKHKVQFDFDSGGRVAELDGRYTAYFLSTDSRILTGSDDIEAFREKNIFLYGFKNADTNKYQILLFPDAIDTYAFVVLVVDVFVENPSISFLADANEGFSIASDTVTEWN